MHETKKKWYDICFDNRHSLPGDDDDVDDDTDNMSTCDV